MQESKKHHHVPIFYLRRWSGEGGQVHVIRNINGKIVRSNHAPAHLGFEYHLYSYHEDFVAADRAEIETKFFAPLDNQGAKIVTKMIAGSLLEKRERILWVQFLLSMKVRTPENVERIRNEGEKVLTREMEGAQREYKQLKQDSDPDTAIDWLRVNRPGLIESIGVGQLSKIISNKKAMRDVLSFDWHIVDFKRSSKSLLTSDRPCVYTQGLANPNCVIALPLSPRHAFFACRSNSTSERVLMKMPISRLAARLNESVVGQAITRAYSKRESDAPNAFFQRWLSVSAQI